MLYSELHICDNGAVEKPAKLFQETKISKQNKDTKFIKFAIVRRDRKTGGKGGGLIFLIDKQIPFQHADIPEDPYDPIEVQAITIQSEAEIINIINTYIPPDSSCVWDTCCQ